MRVLITGAQGQLGHELMRLAPLGFDTVGMGSAELDISDAERVAVVAAELQPHLIINAAAYTAVDEAESEMERAWAINRCCMYPPIMCLPVMPANLIGSAILQALPGCTERASWGVSWSWLQNAVAT